MNFLRFVKPNLKKFPSSWLAYEVHIRDSFDYTYLLKKCFHKKILKEIHAQIIVGGYQQDPFLASKLIGKYIDLPPLDMDVAHKVFDELPERDAFLWNMMIQGYSKHGHFEGSLRCFKSMRGVGFPSNEYSFTFVLKACGEAKEMKAGRMIHGQIVKCGCDSDLFVSNALVAFYGKCQEISSSRMVFDVMLERDIVSWNSMISAYVVNDLHLEALEVFRFMMMEGTVSPDRVTLVGILPSCAHQSALMEGLWIHCYIVKSCLELDAAFGSGLIMLYANVGRLKTAKLVFDQVTDKNIVVWNAIIRAYGVHSHADEALKLFSRLVGTGLRPDGLIFLCLISACSHAGMVSEGIDLFDQMEKYGVEKRHEHYACMIDLYGRAGLIDKALEFIKTMPIEAGKDAYGALLGACSIHNNIEVAEEVAKKLFDLDPDNAGRYLIMASIYGHTGRNQDVARLKTIMRDKKIQKAAGASSIEVGGTYHTFGVEVEAHPFKEQIFDTLHNLLAVIKDGNVIDDQAVVNS